MSRETRVRSAKRRRQVGIAAMVIAVAGLMVPAAAFAKGPSKAMGAVETVEICHVNGASDTINGFNRPDRHWAMGQVMTIPANAFDGHAGHGDVLTSSALFRVLADTRLDEAAERDELKIWKHADCAVWINPEVG